MCLHGAGHSALSFAAFAKCLKQTDTVVSFDFRGHGENSTANPTDLSADTLIGDSIEVIRHLSSIYKEQSIILVGHSMGGSIATKTVDKI